MANEPQKPDSLASASGGTPIPQQPISSTPSATSVDDLLKDLPPKMNTPVPSSSIPTTGPVKSEIRTMQDDLAALAKGKTPSSAPMELKPPTPTPLPPPVASEVPKTPPAPPITSPQKPPLPPEASVQPKQLLPPIIKPITPPSVTLTPKPPEKPLTPPTPPTTEQKPITPTPPAEKTPSVIIPPTTSHPGLSKKFIFLIIILLLVGGGVFLYLRKQEPKITITTPPPETPSTPTPTATPTLSLSQLFAFSGNDSSVKPITISTSNKLKSIQDAFVKNSPPLKGMIGFSLANETGTTLSFSEFLTAISLAHPSGLQEALDENDFLLIAYGQQEQFSDGVQKFLQTPTTKKIVLVKIIDSSAMQSILNVWEPTIIADWEKFFGYKKNQAFSQHFLDSNYQGFAIRYINFPYPDVSFDYALVKSRSGIDYLAITNSRESMFAIIDFLIQY